MWRIWAEGGRDGERIALSNIKQRQVDPSPAVAWELVQEAYLRDPPHSARFLETEMALSREHPLPGSDAIARWGEYAQGKVEDKRKLRRDEFRFDGHGLIWIPGDDWSIRGLLGHPRSVAWHDRTLVVVPVTEEYRALFFEYIPELKDVVLGMRYEKQFGPHAAFLEWRGYFGDHSWVSDGIKRLYRRGQEFTARLARSPKGFLVGKIVRVCGKPPGTISRDPAFGSRQDDYARKYPKLERAYPDLHVAPVQKGRCCFIFVHGTLSCSLESLRHLHPDTLPDGSTLRFEHDTFRSPIENAKELVGLIKQKIRTQDLWLIAHSRGGLVARYVAQWLATEQYSLQPTVLTFGTPHLGTPLADASRTILNVLYKAGGYIFKKAIPVPGFVSAAYGYHLMNSPVPAEYTTTASRWWQFVTELLQMKDLPKGIAAMSPTSGFLESMNDNPAKVTLSAYGGWVDVNKTDAFEATYAETAFPGQQTDLIVTTDSATGAGRPYIIPDCSHFDYFTHDEVKQKLGAVRDSCSGRAFRPRHAGTDDNRDLSIVPKPESPQAKTSDLPVEDEFLKNNLHDLIGELERRSAQIAAMNLKTSIPNEPLAGHLFDLANTPTDLERVARAVEVLVGKAGMPISRAETDLRKFLNDKGFYGSYCELGVYDWLDQHGASFNAQIHLTGQDVLNPNGCEIDGRLEFINAYFDVKAMGFSEYVADMFRKKLEQKLSGLTVTIDGPMDVSVKKIEADAFGNLDALAKKLAGGGIERIPTLGWTLRAERPRAVRMMEHTYDPYRLATENRYYPFKTAAQFTRNAPFLLIFAYAAKFNRMLFINFAGTTEITLRSIARRAFIQLTSDSVTPACRFDDQVACEISIADAAHLLGGLLFINLDNDDAWLYLNPRATHQLTRTHVERMFDFTPHPRLTVDDFVHDNY